MAGIFYILHLEPKMGILNFKRRRQVADDAFESDLTPEQSSQYQAEDHDGMQRLKPVVR